MTVTKKKVTVTLDADLVEALDTANGSFSAELNSALRERVEKQRRDQALGCFLDELDEEDGGPPPEEMIEEWVRRLS